MFVSKFRPARCPCSGRTRAPRRRGRHAAGDRGSCRPLGRNCEVLARALGDRAPRPTQAEGLRPCHGAQARRSRLPTPRPHDVHPRRARQLPLQAVPARAGLTLASQGEGDARRRGRRPLRSLRVRPLPSRPSVPPPRPAREGLRAFTSGHHAQPREGARRGSLVHVALRELSCRDRGWVPRTRRRMTNERLPGVDSNHQELINSQSCCRYITGDRHRRG
jgi:hypothetical protein